MRRHKHRQRRGVLQPLRELEQRRLFLAAARQRFLDLLALADVMLDTHRVKEVPDASRTLDELTAAHSTLPSLRMKRFSKL